MKNKKKVGPSGALPLLALVVFVLCFVVSRPYAQSLSGSSNAKVSIRGSVWIDPPPEDYIEPPPVEISCGSVEAYAGAQVEDACVNPPSGGRISGDPSYTKSGSGFDVTTITNGPGWAVYLITVIDPEAEGSKVKVKSTVTGPVTVGYDDNNQPICVTKTYTTVGTVVLKKAKCGCSGGANPALGSGSADNNSVDFHLYLGPASPVSDGGYLWLKADAPSASLATPAALQLPYTVPNVEVITNQSSGIIEQTLAPQGLVNVYVVNNYEYQLQCFYVTNVTAKVSGHYGTNAAAFAAWSVRNPDGAAANNRLWITELRGGVSHQFQYTYTSASLRWDLLRPDGNTLSTWKTPVGGSPSITNYFRQVSAGSSVLMKRQETREYVSSLNDTLLKQLIEGDGSVTRTTTYTYYSSGPGANKVQRIDYPDGRWEYFAYNSQGRTAKEYSAYLNYPPPISGEPNISAGDRYRLTEYSYAIDATSDTYISQTIQTTVSLPFFNGSTWDMKEVARTYNYTDSGSSQVQQCVEPGAAWDDPSNLKSITYRYVASDFTGGKPSTVISPDGRTIDYYYPDKFTTQESHNDGTYVETVVDDWGKPQSITRFVNGTLVESLTYNYKDVSNHYYDELRQSYDVTDLAGRTIHYSYGCCNLDSIVDVDSATTQFDYDTLKRQVASTRYYGGTSGIKTTNILDAVGQTLAVQRIGTNGSAITLQQSQYDVLGRTVRSTNALAGVTVYTNVVIGNQLYVTNTYSDGGTRIEVNCRDGRLERILGTAVPLAHYVYGVEQDGSGGPWREFTQEIKLDASGNDTAEWTKTYTDAAGRVYKKVFSAASQPYPYSQTWYNNEGQQWKQRDPDGLWTLYKYNSTDGEPEYTVVPLGSASTIYSGISSYVDLDYYSFDPALHFNTADRIARVTRSVVAADSGKPDRTKIDSYVWDDAQTSGTLFSSVENSADGLRTWQTSYRDISTSVVSQMLTVHLGGGSRNTTNTLPDGSYSVGTYSYGRLISMTRYSSTGVQLSKTSYSFDAHGRQYGVTDGRNGATSYTYNDADQVSSVVTPAPGVGQSAQTTLMNYNAMLQVKNVVQPDGTSVTNTYHLNGLLKGTFGSRNYPIGYGYDAQGRMTKMTNWTNFVGGSGPRVTTWSYNAYRGWLDATRYDDNNGSDYTYSVGGRLKTRKWARIGTSSQRIVSTYSYGFDDGVGNNDHGDLVNIAYTYDPQSTPPVTYVYDRRARKKTVAQGSTTATLTYNNANELLTEGYSGGTLGGYTVTSGYDTVLRRTSLSLNTSPSMSRTYSYDFASRLTNVTDGTYSAGYTYLANSPLVSQIAFRQSGTVRMTTSRQYDFQNRLLAISSAPGAVGQLPIAYGYQYNDANQRTSVTLNDGSYWIYQYDPLGQVTSGKKYWTDGTPVPGQQFEYGFDDIGNRTSTRFGGDAAGGNLRSATYSANTLNQYSSRTVPGGFDVIGIANVSSGVTVNSSAADYRRGEYFQELVNVSNGSVPVWQSVSVMTSGGGAASGNVWTPKTPENYGYDLDGNQTSDGRWTYTWDAENRLIRLVANTATGPQQRLDFEYDWKGRRISKKVWNNTSGTGTPAVYLKFAYDGRNLIVELDGNNANAVNRAFLWGLDLSGSEQGAGGVGGLLAIKPASGNPSFVSYDGNGNTAGLIDATTGTTTGNFEYGPFGEALRLTPNSNNQSPFRLSTKYQDVESDLVYYGDRYYNPCTGRWLSRDPIKHGGGANLYGFVANEPVSTIDYIGHKPIKLQVLYWNEQDMGPHPGIDVDDPKTGNKLTEAGVTRPAPGSPTYKPWRWKSPRDPCCYQISARGTLEVAYWYTLDPESKPHELTHVAIYFYNWADLDSLTAGYIDRCFKLGVADCYVQYLKKTYVRFVARVNYENLQFDCDTYGPLVPSKCSDAKKEFQKWVQADAEAYALLLKCLALEKSDP